MSTEPQSVHVDCWPFACDHMSVDSIVARTSCTSNDSLTSSSHNIVNRSNVLIFISLRILCDSWEFSGILAAVSLSLLSQGDSIFSYNFIFYLYKYVCKNSISLWKYQFLQAINRMLALTLFKYHLACALIN